MEDPQEDSELRASDLLSQRTSGCAEQAIIISCQASPVAERKSTRTAC